MFFEACYEKFMDSINKQQPEKNYEDLLGKEALKKIKEINDKATACFMCTNIQTAKPFATRPMNIQQLDEQGNFWFLSATDSHKNKEIATDPAVQLLLQGSSYSDFLNVYGHATISTDKKKIKELWNPMLKTWFKEGEDDPRISVIKVEPREGYYWDVKHNQAIAFMKRIAGAITGKTLDDSIEGKVKM